jgi:mannose-1-phosphate guanylyltransferase/mannose-6-phosphate isomerase
MKDRIVSVLLIGGKGERFWPRSRKGMPKQFLPIVSDSPMLIDTLERVRPISARLLTVSGVAMSASAREIAAAHGLGDRIETVEEAAPRSTAPALGLAALRCKPDEIIVALPSDHHIPDARRFQDVILNAAAIAARKKGIVCIGITPSRPETGYGYIRLGDPVDGPGYRIASFVEKPPQQRAIRLIEEGALWNGGIFVVRAGVYLDLVERYIPELHRVLSEIRSTGDAGLFSSAPAISVDHGILENCGESYAVRGDFEWDDVGDWGAMARIYGKDASGNSVRGAFVGFETKHLIIDSDAGLVAAVGVEDLAIIRNGDIVLVVKRGMEQNVREILAQLTDEDLKSFR